MKQRTPMSRGSGFARKVYERAPAAPLRRVERSGVLAQVSTEVSAAPKPEQHRNPHLLGMARGRPCLFRLAGICTFDPATTVACHSNLGAHGKAGARKANDEYSAWGCFACHSWLDQGRGDPTTKRMTFMLAHLSQVGEWRRIAASAAADTKDRAAAQWALDHLNATPVGLGAVT